MPRLVSVIAFVGALAGFLVFYRMPGGGRHTPEPTLHAGRGLVLSSISGLVVEYIVAIDVTRVQFPADALCNGKRRWIIIIYVVHHMDLHCFVKHKLRKSL